MFGKKKESFDQSGQKDYTPDQSQDVSGSQNTGYDQGQPNGQNGQGYYQGQSMQNGQGYYQGQSMQNGQGYYQGQGMQNGRGYYQGQQNGQNGRGYYQGNGNSGYGYGFSGNDVGYGMNGMGNGRNGNGGYGNGGYGNGGGYNGGYGNGGGDPRREAPVKKKRKKWPVVLLVILALVVAAGAFVFAWLGRMNTTTLSDTQTNTGVASVSGYRTFVLYGVDSRDNQLTTDTRSDSIIIVSINEKTDEVKMASVYRDTYLDNTDGHYRKATDCYQYGGPQLSINMLNKNLDLNIQDYITVNFQSVIEIVDLLGGIDLDITDEEMELINGYCVENKEVTGVDYTPLTSSGYVHLSGIQALAYCRIRYTEGWDYKRTERQRTVITLCYQKAREQGVTSLVSMVNTMLPYISTSMSQLELISLVSNLSKYTLSEEGSTGFPFEKTTADLSDAGDCVIAVNLAQNVTELHQFLYNETDYTPSETVQEISNTIMNNTGVTG